MKLWKAGDWTRWVKRQDRFVRAEASAFVPPVRLFTFELGAVFYFHDAW